ncbi:hypothetical protein BXT86_06695 [candidate division WOR-3 bacterium 4484_100]|uniref:Glycosyltransferase RgtA/B/C/D-like domain-containing protein n=1 Tax=candidate division WOR-3 bacterium 4484_100 TaxID=1936077 RepID=A0A1V4QDG1_UNCW3|nr:MAG: hypothetical protein BXT86_06695 [candidate division WOR-3 bacterium 4484_100]
MPGSRIIIKAETRIKQMLKNFDYNRASWIIVGIGIILRVVQYLYNRSLTEGEAALAINIVHRSYSDLLHPLDLTQAAPIGFLFIEKFFLNLLGNSEYSLRIFPLISGLLSLFLFFIIVKRILSRPASLLSLLLFAIGNYLIYFSSEVKPYSSDVLITLLIIALTLYVLEKRFSLNVLLFFNIAGAVVIWFSYPALFLFGAGVILIILVLLQEKRQTAFISSIIFLTIPLISFFIYYRLSLIRIISHNPELVTTWQNAFLPLIPCSLNDLARLGYCLAKVLKNPIGLSIYELFLAAVAFVIGTVYMYIKKRNILLLLLIPIFLTTIASALKRYPFEGRLLLFLVPLLLPIIAEGIIYIAKKTARGSILIASLFPLIIVLGPAAVAGYHIIKPRAPEELRPVLQYLQKNKKEEDTIYLYYASINAYNYYKEFLTLEGPVVYGNPSRQHWGNYFEELKKLKGKGRVWFLFSHIATKFGVDEEKLFVSYLDILGKRLDVYKAPGASAYLYDLSE